MPMRREVNSEVNRTFEQCELMEKSWHRISKKPINGKLGEITMYLPCIAINGVYWLLKFECDFDNRLVEFFWKFRQVKLKIQNF